MAKLKKNILSSGNLKYRLRIAFCLMSILPLLVTFYIVSNNVLPLVGFKLDAALALSLIISIFIAVIGFFLVKEVFDRVLMISSEAKLIAQGDTNRVVDAGKEDEVGYLGESLNQLTLQIRNSMDELKGYSERTTQINIEIQKRVLALSSLLQISSLISQGLRLEEILKLTVEKSRILANSDASFLLFREGEDDDFYIKTFDGMHSQQFAMIRIPARDAVFGVFAKSTKPLILDQENKLQGNLQKEFSDKFKLRNLLALPIYLRGKVKGVLCIGNTKEEFLYKKEDAELLDIFAKQVAIAVENDLLLRWVEKLEIKDALTGLYNEAFIRSRLQEEIKRAILYQRPCAFILLNIDNFQGFRENFGSLQAESILKKVAALITESITDIDRAARVGDNEFGVVLPEKNKRQAQTIAEDIRKKIEFVFSEAEDARKKITVSGGVSENPLDGISSEELISKAKELVNVSRGKGANHVSI